MTTISDQKCYNCVENRLYTFHTKKKNLRQYIYISIHIIQILLNYCPRTRFCQKKKLIHFRLYHLWQTNSFYYAWHFNLSDVRTCEKIDWWSTIPPISTKWTTTSHLKPINHNRPRHTWDIGIPGPGLRQAQQCVGVKPFRFVILLPDCCGRMLYILRPTGIFLGY